MTISQKQNEYLCITGENEQDGGIKLQRYDVLWVNTFKYFGTTVQKDGDEHIQVGRRINAAWHGWKKITGILRDRRAPSWIWFGRRGEMA